MNVRFIAAPAVAGFAFASALAGPLDPPAGPVAPTGRFGPRIEVSEATTPGDADSLYKITEPGSYYVAGNIQGVANKHGIEIESDDVTLDLMGFTLTGASSGLNPFDGIRLSLDAVSRNVEIRNGTVRGWCGDGVNARSGAGTRVFSVRAIGNQGGGICVDSFGDQATFESSMIEGCDAVSNGLNGIVVRSGATVLNCQADFNMGDGFDVASNCIVRACLARRNKGDGIRASGVACVIKDCVSQLNEGNGVLTGSAATVIGTSAASNGGTGFVIGGASLVADCAAKSNQGVGISVAEASTVSRSVCFVNKLDGILVRSSCVVTDNLCDTNGFNNTEGAGIRVLGEVFDPGECRIENNNVTRNVVGLLIESPENVIVRNTARANRTANYDIVAGNACFVISAPVSGAILGDSGGTPFGSGEPWANLSY